MSAMSGPAESWEENTDLIPRVVWARRSARLLISGVLAAAVIAGATFAVPATPHVDARAEEVLRAQAIDLATALDTTARTAHARSDQIAGNDVLRAAILTDAKTIADLMASKQLSLQPGPGETMELFQRDGDQVTSLVRIPANAAPIRWMRGAGTRLENVGDRLHVVVTAGVDRLKEGEGYKPTISGSLAVSDPIDLAAVRTQLATAVTSAVLEGAGATPLVVLDGPRDGQTLRATVHPNPEWFGDLTLVVTPKTHLARPAWVGAVRIVSALVALVLLAMVIVRKRKR
jgi:hypothetical protein